MNQEILYIPRNRGVLQAQPGWGKRNTIQISGDPALTNLITNQGDGQNYVPEKVFSSSLWKKVMDLQ